MHLQMLICPCRMLESATTMRSSLKGKARMLVKRYRLSNAMFRRYYDAQAKCPMMAANGSVMTSSLGQPMYTDYYYANANGMDTKNCYGYIQVRYWLGRIPVGHRSSQGAWDARRIFNAG